MRGQVLWEGHARMDLLHGSTDVLEATAVVEACGAVVTVLQEHQVIVHPVLAFCDNQGAATTHRKPTHKGGSLMDRVVCDFHDLAEQIPLVMGWCPAQHDTKLQGVLARLNERADKAAKQARTHMHKGLWTMPQMDIRLPGIVRAGG